MMKKAESIGLFNKKAEGLGFSNRKAESIGLFNKKAEIGSTAVWIAATFIILFLIVIYLAAMFWFFETKDAGITYQKLSEEGNSVDFITVKKFISFLNIPLENGAKPAEILALYEAGKTQEADEELFVESLRDFLELNSPYYLGAVSVKSIKVLSLGKSSADFIINLDLSYEDYGAGDIAEAPVETRYYYDSLFFSPKTKIQIMIGTE